MHPHTMRVLCEEFGIEFAHRSPRHLDTLGDHRFDAVITVCDRAREACPELGDNPRWIHWSIPDSAEATGTHEDSYPNFRATATEIDTRIRFLLPVLTTGDLSGRMRNDSSE